MAVKQFVNDDLVFQSSATPSSMVWNTDGGGYIGLKDDSNLGRPISAYLKESLVLEEVTTPANPPSNNWKFYVKADEKLYQLKSDGTESEVGGGLAGSGTDENIVRWDGTGALQDSLVTVTDVGDVGIPYGHDIIATGTTTPLSRIALESNAINIYVRNDTAPKVSFGQWSSYWNGHLNTSTNGSYDLGATGTRWRNAYLRNAYLGGANIPATLKLATTAPGNLATIQFSNVTTSASAYLGAITGQWQDTDVAKIQFISGTDTGNHDDGQMLFMTSETGGSPTERLRITQDGDVTIEKNLDVKGQAGSPLNTLSDAASIATDCDTGNTHIVTLAGNRALANPTNLTAGYTYSWIVKQDGTGSRTLSYGTAFKFPGGTAPVLSTAASAVDVLTGIAESSTVIHCNMQKDLK